MNTSDLLCDLYDIREMGKLCGFGKLPKDNEGTSFTIDEAQNYWEDHYDDVVEEVKEYVK